MLSREHWLVELIAPVKLAQDKLYNMNGRSHFNGSGQNGRSGTQTPNTHTVHARPLVLLHPATQTRISILTPSTPQEWIAAEVARDTFQDWIHATEKESPLVGFESVEATSDDSDEASAQQDQFDRELALTSYFLKHVSELLHFPSGTSPSTAQVLLAAYNHFSAQYLAATEVHSLAAKYPAPVRALIISSYYNARTKLQVAGHSKDLPKFTRSALLAAAGTNAEVYGLFGGQGMNEVYFDELQVSLVALRFVAR